MKTLWQDIHYGVRMLLKKPGFTAVAVITLTLGIGANTAIFSVVNAVLLRGLPYERPEQLAVIWETHPEGKRLGFDLIPASAANFVDWRNQSDSFEQVAAFDSRNMNLTGRDEPEQLGGVRVSANLLSLLRVEPVLGRGFLPEEEQPGRNRVVLLSHGFWQRRFGANGEVLGQTLALNGESYTIVGVMPADFRFPQDANLPPYFSFAAQTDVLMPLALTAETIQNRGSHNLAVIGRLKPSAGLRQAQAEMDGIVRRIAEQNAKYKDWGVKLVSLHEQVVSGSRLALLVLLGAVALVLAVACANVANLLLARAATRQKEIAIRTALGASRLRIIRQLLTESVLLSVVAGLLGVLLAVWGTELLVALSPGNIPRLGEIGIDARVLGFTLLISLLTGVIFGLVPALGASKPNLNETLKEGDRGSTGSRHRVRGLLVVSEIALALVLLVGAGLLIKSFWRLQQVTPGFNPESVLTMDIALPDARYPEDQQRAIFYQQLTERIEQLPGVQAVGTINTLPLSGRGG